MRWHLYNYHPHNLMLAESVPVTDTYAEGDSIQWGNAKIRVINTPGHTDGSVSYAVEVDGTLFRFLRRSDLRYGADLGIITVSKKGERQQIITVSSW